MEFHFTVVQLQSDLAFQDHHLINRIRRVPPVFSDSLDDGVGRGSPHDGIGQQIDDAPARPFLAEAPALLGFPRGRSLAAYHRRSPTPPCTTTWVQARR